MAPQEESRELPPALPEPALPVVCAWCNAPMRDGVGRISHGICPECAARFEGDESPPSSR